MKRSDSIRIGAVVWLNQGFGRRVFVAIQNHVAAAHPHVEVQVVDASKLSPPYPASAWNDLDGLLVMLDDHDADEMTALTATPLPTILVPRIVPNACRWTSVGTDPASIARVVHEHLQSRRIDKLAITFPRYFNFHSELEAAFRDACEKAGGTWIPPKVASVTHPANAAMAKWIKSLPAECAVLCTNDNQARYLLHLIGECGRKVPDEIAVVGIEDDPFSCMGRPTLTSVRLRAEQAGAEALDMLIRRIRGEEIKSVILTPDGIAARQSTNTLGGSDPLLRRAIQFMRANLQHPIDAAEVAAYAGCSRRALYNHFEKTLGRPVYEELARLRLERATHLLTHTDEPIKTMGNSVGIADSANFSAFIKRSTGLSPRAYRAKAHSNGDRQ
jgi:LacI family transcriptional regulator